MSKFTKLVSNPKSFFEDAVKNRLGHVYRQSELMLDYFKESINEKSLAQSKVSSSNTGRPLAKNATESVPVAIVAKDDLPKELPGVGALPVWYNLNPPKLSSRQVRTEKPVFLYVSWIIEHTNLLLEKLQSDEYELIEFDFSNDINLNRRDILHFARNNPVLYRKMVLKKLVQVRHLVDGFIFTFDWSPVMRIISSACEELGIKRVLIPHESVFVDRTKYYWDITSMASMPNADIVLAWGQLQKEIFIERGYPSKNIIVTGTPKLDKYKNYSPSISRDQFCGLYGLDPAKKTILFASQPLDSQLDKKLALTQQRLVINDLMEIINENNYQLIIRCPPSKDNILNLDLVRRIYSQNNVAVDDANCYLVGPEEALYHSDLVVSINSTMLFEGVLMGRPALSMKYIDFEQIWENVGIPVVKNIDQLRDQVSFIINEWRPSVEGMQWAADKLSVGEFDGQAGERIRNYLIDIAKNPEKLVLRQNAQSRLINNVKDDKVDVVGIHSPQSLITSTQKYLLELLNANRRVQTEDGLDKPEIIASVDLFLQWGITSNAKKIKQAIAQRYLGRPLIVIEDGFIRSLDIGLSGEPALSIIIDDITAYYDATTASRLELMIKGSRGLTVAESERALNVIQCIVNNKISKYNHAPQLPIKIGDMNRPKILLVDQRKGDQSVLSGMADDESFTRMLYDALKKYPNYDIIIKQHPDAIKGGKLSYFNSENLDPVLKAFKNIYPITLDVNPYSLFDIVEKVFVVSSGMGFEALLAGKEVHCYGAPYYSGWGLTVDNVHIERRAEKRTLEEVFHYAYIKLSRYYSPSLSRACEIEDLIDYIVKQRKN